MVFFPTLLIGLLIGSSIHSTKGTMANFQRGRDVPFHRHFGIWTYLTSIFSSQSFFTKTAFWISVIQYYFKNQLLSESLDFQISWLVIWLSEQLCPFSANCFPRKISGGIQPFSGHSKTRQNQKVFLWSKIKALSFV